MFKLSEVTPRVQRLRQLHRDSIPTLDADRTRIITEYYKESIYEVPIIRRARACYEILTKMQIRVEPDELIVGNVGKYFRGVNVWAEYGLDWLVNDFDSGVFDERENCGSDFIMPLEDREYIRSVADFWRENGNEARIGKCMPDDINYVGKANVTPHRAGMNTSVPHGHYNANYRKVVVKGFGAIKKQALEHIEELRGNIWGKDAEKWFFYQAVVICCDAAIAFSKRFAEECRRQAAEQTDEKRKAELLKMADSLDWIMENPCRTYWEACQAIYLYHLILNIEGSYLGLTIGRFDQQAGDLLEADLAAGRITMDEAQEITDCFCLKVADLMVSGSKFMMHQFSYSNNMRLTLSGRKMDGSDATNTCTYLCLQTIARLKLHDPTLSLCLHKDSPAELWEAGIETAKTCGGIPTLDNTDLIIDMLHKRGLSIEDARNFCVIGCVELSGSGCEFSNVSGPFSKTHLSIANVVLQAINDGKNPLDPDKTQAGLHTGYLYNMESFDEVKSAFYRQLEYFMNWHQTFNNILEFYGNPLVPVPMASATMDGCMEKGKDMLVGGAKYNSTGGAAIGMGTCIDSLLAIKYACFDKKLCTTREMYDAIMANWEGYELLRARIKSETPFWGNGTDEADEMASWVSDQYADRFNSYIGPRGGHRAGIYSAAANVMHGYWTGATPNGRKAHEPVADGGSPSQGADKSGPTAVAKSIIAMHPYKYSNGYQFTMKFHPNSVAGEAGTEKLHEFVESFFEQGGMQVQYNVVSSETLRDAQKNPDEYKDLVVRVAGFSAYFVELHSDLQNDLISRTDNEM
jgi:formate C-acetyltransferase